MKVKELESGTLFKPKAGSCLVTCTSRKSPPNQVKVVPDVIGPGFPSFISLLGGTWMYLGPKRIPSWTSLQTDEYVMTGRGSWPPNEEESIKTKKVHEIFHSIKGIFTIDGRMFKDLKPLLEKK